MVSHGFIVKFNLSFGGRNFCFEISQVGRKIFEWKGIVARVRCMDLLGAHLWKGEFGSNNCFLRLFCFTFYPFYRLVRWTALLLP